MLTILQHTGFLYTIYYVHSGFVRNNFSKIVTSFVAGLQLYIYKHWLMEPL